MKKLFYFFILTSILSFYSCEDDKKSDYTTYAVTIQLVYPEGSVLEVAKDIKVKLTDSNGKIYDGITDDAGKTIIIVPTGIYTATADDSRAEGFTYNGRVNNIVVTKAWDETLITDLFLEEEKKGSIVIKELYVGGCQKGNDAGVFQHDKYVILHNNSNETVTLDNLCLGMVLPYNAHGSNKDYVNGNLFYAAEGWIPAGTGIWYYPGTLTIESGKDVVIALANAVDNTQTYSNSINFNKAEYYCTYDNAVYSNTTYYPAPAPEIPGNHYWSAVHFGQGNAWPLSTLSPAFYIFRTADETPTSFVNNELNTNYHGGTMSDANKRKKVPVEWILDGVEVFTTTSTENQKRLTAKVDIGQTYLTNKYGYSSYRNVDADATKAIEGNASKLVYNYNKGTEINGVLSTDPSGIDAEASIKKGARIIYKDTNNSTNDFHQRKQASLRD